MSKLEKLDRDLRTYGAILQAVAWEESKYMPDTPEDVRVAEELAAFTREQVAARRRAELTRRPSNVVSGAVRPSILAMARDQVVALLSALRTQHPTLAFCHRELEAVTDDDLRSALEDALSLIERP